MVDYYDELIYGYIEDDEDLRDYLYPEDNVSNLPASADISDRVAAVKNQGSAGSCVAFATTSALEFLDHKDDLKSFALSPLFTYYLGRAAYFMQNKNVGTQIRTVIKELFRVGVCEESDFAYSADKIYEKPPLKAYASAKKNRALRYERITSLDGFKKAICGGLPVVFGFRTFKGQGIDGRSGQVDLPSDPNMHYGGHAVLAVGYDDATNRIKFLNSWGQGWGDNGFGYLTYDFFEHGYVKDCWVIVERSINKEVKITVADYVRAMWLWVKSLATLRAKK